MVPATVGGVVVLLVLVIPGLHYQLLRGQRRPGRDDSTFVEISRTLLAGALLSGLTLALIGLARFVTAGGIVDIRRALFERHYIESHLILMAWSTTWFLILALTVAAFTASAWPGDIRVHPESAWIMAFASLPRTEMRQQRKKHTWTYIEVTLKNGERYRGSVSSYSHNLTLEDRELILKEPIMKVGENESASSPAEASDWSRLVIPGSEVVSILARYGAEPAGLEGDDQSFWRTASKPFAWTASWIGRHRTHSGMLAWLLCVELVTLLLCSSLA